jgi:hypothetical protein
VDRHLNTAAIPTGFRKIGGDNPPTRQPICHVALNGEFGNNRDASVRADGTKSRLPKQMACALRPRNSSRVAIQAWRGAWRLYCLRDRTAHPTQKEETGETGSPSSPSQLAQIHRRNSAHIEQSAKTAFLIFPSQLPPIFISWRDQMLAAFTSAIGI